MADIGSITPSVERDAAAFGMLAELAQQLRPASPFPRGFGQQNDGAIQPDRQDVIIGDERLERRPMSDVSAKTSDAGEYGLARLGMPPQFARQGEKAERGVEIDVGRFHRSRQSYPPLLFLPVGAELDVVAIWPFLKGDRPAADWVASQRGLGGGVLLG